MSFHSKIYNFQSSRILFHCLIEFSQLSKILNHPSIEVNLNSMFTRSQGLDFDHVFWTGPIDAYFEYEHGRLGYRTLDFEQHISDGDFQGCPVMNYCDETVPFTRITEHKHFAPWETHDRTVTYREFSGGHNYTCWRDEVGIALEHLFGI